MKTISLLVTISLFCLQFISAQNSDAKLFNQIESAFSEENYAYIIQQKAAILDAVETKADTTTAELLYYLGASYLAYDSLGQALVIMEKELDIRKQLPDSDPLLIADIQFNLAFYLQLNNDFERSKSLFEQASKIYEENLGTANPSYVESQIEIAKVYGVLGDHRKSMNILEDLLKIKYVTKNYEHVVKKELGMTYFDMGYYSQSEKTLKENQASVKANFGEESVEYAEALMILAIPYYYRSQYSEAELLYAKTLEILSKLVGNESLEDNTKNNLALLYWKIGLYDEALSIFKEIIGNEPTLQNASTYSNYAQNLIQVGQTDLAIDYFDKALGIIKGILGTESELFTRVLKEKAIALNKINDLDEYYKTMNESFLISQQILEKSNPEYSKYEIRWGLANFRLNNIKEAEKHLNKAHELRGKYLSKSHPLYAESSKELAKLNWYKNNHKQAKELFHETFTNYFTQIEAYFPALSEQQKANFYSNTLRSTFEEFNSFAIAYEKKDKSLLDDMYNYQLATKGIIMYATAKARKNILNSDDDVLKGQYQNWISTKELIAQYYSMSEKEASESSLNLDSLSTRANAIEKDLSRASADFADAYVAKDYKWTDVQKQLKGNEAAIEMIRFRKYTPDSSGLYVNKVNYAVLLIDKNSKHPELILLENGMELEGKYIKNYKNSIKYKVTDKYSYEYYWKAIADRTSRYKTIYFSPDGVYNMISVNSLYNNETQKYVLEEQNIQLVTNTKDLIASNQSNKKSTTASVPSLFGAPNYNKGIVESDSDLEDKAKDIVENASLNRGLRGSLQRYIRGNSLVVALPGTKEEVDKIGALYSTPENEKPNIYLANEADEAQLKSVNSPKVLHIATHGFFLEDNESSEDDIENKYTENPLLKSGLIMAGANSFISQGFNVDVQQDGILTAYEAMNLNLHGTELVVLSACETGLGDLKNGEGVYGLRRAFQVAGAEAIIMSLWSVNDLATQELMTAFYENWLGGQDKQTAFSNAQKTLKLKYESPFYWGGFVMVGE